MKPHLKDCTCSICERNRTQTFSFKGGYVCEQCLEFVKLTNYNRKDLNDNKLTTLHKDRN